MILRTKVVVCLISVLVTHCVGAMEQKNKIEWKERRLFAAVKSGNTLAIKLLLAMGARADARDEYGRIPLHYVRSTAAVTSLLHQSNSLLLRCQDKAQCSPLHYAAVYASPKVVQTLLDCSALRVARDEKDFTPLHYAAFYCRVGNLELLYDRECRINTKLVPPLHLEKPLEYAICSTAKVSADQRECTIKKLIALDASQVNPQAFRAAIKSGRSSLIKLLLPFYTLDPEEIKHIVRAITGVRRYTFEQEQKFLDVLVEYVGAHQKNGINLKHGFLLATMLGNEKSIKALWRYGIEEATQVQAWEQILRENNVISAVSLLKLGSKPRLPEELGATQGPTVPLHIRAAYYRKFKLVSLLYAFGSDPHEQGTRGTTLHYAVQAARDWCSSWDSSTYYLALFPTYADQLYQKIKQQTFTFLLCNKRQKIFPKDLMYKIIAHLPAYYIYDTKLLRLCLPHIPSQKGYLCDTNLLQQVAQDYPDCAKATELLILQEERARELCAIPNKDGKLAYELVPGSHPKLAKFLEPATLKILGDDK